MTPGLGLPAIGRGPSRCASGLWRFGGPGLRCASSRSAGSAFWPSGPRAAAPGSRRRRQRRAPDPPVRYTRGPACPGCASTAQGVGALRRRALASAARRRHPTERVPRQAPGDGGGGVAVPGRSAGSATRSDGVHKGLHLVAVSLGKARNPVRREAEALGTRDETRGLDHRSHARQDWDLAALTHDAAMPDTTTIHSMMRG